jgi:FixJ family two-component response regulator
MKRTTGHIYIVEDDLDIRSHLSMLLREAGYTAREYSSAEDFLLNSTIVAPSVILLDMRMQGLSGLELQQTLRESELHTPIIYISGESERQEIIDAMKMGAFDFICKPFDIDKLFESIDRALEFDKDLHSKFQRLEDLRKKYQFLTAREKELIAIILNGHTNREISALTGIQAGTAKKHRAVILEKMGVYSTSELITLFKGLSPDEL